GASSSSAGRRVATITAVRRQCASVLAGAEVRILRGVGARCGSSAKGRRNALEAAACGGRGGIRRSGLALNCSTKLGESKPCRAARTSNRLAGGPHVVHPAPARSSSGYESVVLVPADSLTRAAAGIV